MKKSLSLVIGSLVLLFMNGCIDIALYKYGSGDTYYAGPLISVRCIDDDWEEISGPALDSITPDHIIFSPILNGADPEKIYECKVFDETCCSEWFIIGPGTTNTSAIMDCGPWCGSFP